MCGICGLVRTKSGVDERSLKMMMKLMKHRGPDDEGLLLEGKVGLGHVRLSIIDLTKKGHQPMSNADESLWIIYNGEIYNYIELRRELKELGAKFGSKTDTEVLLKAYELWGEKCLSRLNGMFSFVIYDKRKNILFGARDRFGIKPFYYHNTAESFIFASEIKPILSTGIKPKPNYNAIHDFIMYRFMYQGESTFFNEIKKLLPGHFIKIELDSAKVEIKKWWDIETELRQIELDEAVSRFDELFKDSVRKRLRSDVPVGSCLSGGLDSSSIVCTMVNILGSSKNVKTFSSTYSTDFSGNEKNYIEDVVQNTGVRSYETEPTPEGLMENLEKLVYYQEEPFLGLSPFAQWEVMKLASKNGMKVLLDGQGGDETLAGYLGYMAFHYADLLKRGKFIQLSRNLKAYKNLHGSSYPKNEIIYPLVPGFIKKRSKKKQAYYMNKEFHRKYGTSDRYLSIVSSRPLIERLKNSMNYQLVELLRFEDKSSMAFSIETRLPFLDYRMVQFLFSLPDEYKLRDGQTKFIFRKIIQGVVPDSISRRHDKIGFATPDESWLKDKKIWDYVNDILLSPKALSRGIITRDGVSKLLANYKSGTMSEARNIWSLVILELWFREYIDGSFENFKNK